MKENFPVWSGTFVTAGDVVFYGTMDGWFKAVDARTGNLLWQFKVGSGIIGQPITYKGPDGKQYVAVLSGVGGWAGAIVAGDLDPRRSDGCARFRRTPWRISARQRQRAARSTCSRCHERERPLCLIVVVAAAALTQRGSARGNRTPSEPCASAPIPTTCPSRTTARRIREPPRGRSSPASCTRTSSYTWWAQRRGFVRNTIKAGACDVLMGVPVGFEHDARHEAVLPVFVRVRLARDDRIHVRSLDDPRLAATSRRRAARWRRRPEHAAGPCPRRARRDREHRRLHLYGNYVDPNPPARIVEAVARGDIDIAVVWGPLAGYYAPRQPTPLDDRARDPANRSHEHAARFRHRSWREAAPIQNCATKLTRCYRANAARSTAPR